MAADIKNVDPKLAGETDSPPAEKEIAAVEVKMRPEREPKVADYFVSTVDELVEGTRTVLR